MLKCQFHSPDKAAALVGVHRSTLDRWVKAGTFVPKVKLGPSRCGFAVEDFDEWIAARRAAAAV
ncbi:helix-turn-helix transcriptional regulator [Sphingomonas sp.]|uniref:helix-turn-helix transcriptional regulator n=1 Tax=Sphingomonas sp. TaxID=28214 RepID=UPI003B00341E